MRTPQPSVTLTGKGLNSAETYSGSEEEQSILLSLFTSRPQTILSISNSTGINHSRARQVCRTLMQKRLMQLAGYGQG